MLVSRSRPRSVAAAPIWVRRGFAFGSSARCWTCSRKRLTAAEWGELPLASMPDPQSMHGEARHETQLERLDRNLEELTGELRVVVTGVQVLFAFLLIVPFNTGFAHVGSFERTVYFVTLIFAALAAVCTIAPSAEHRFLFRQ